MSDDQEPTEAQKLRHLLRDLHRHLDPDAPRFLSTRQRAQALLAKLGEIAGDSSLFGSNGQEAHDEPSTPTAPALPSGPGRARSRTRTPSGQSRRPSDAPAERSEPADAAGIALAEPEQPERTWRDALAEWFWS